MDSTLNARMQFFTKWRNDMPVTINKKSNKEKKMEAQPIRLPMPKKSNDDQLVNICHMMENLTKEKALEHAIAASDMRGYSAFHLGAALSVIHNNGWCDFYEYKNIAELARDKFGISKSTTYDYMAIYNSLIESEVAWESIEHLGWTKIRMFARYLTKGNQKEWIEIADTKNAEELREFVRQSLSKKQDLLISDPPKLSTHVENNNQAAELVSTELAESIPKKVVYNLFPQQIEVVDTAIQLAMGEFETGCD